MGVTSSQTTTDNHAPGALCGYVKYENNEKESTDRLLNELNEPLSSVPKIPEEMKIAYDNELYCHPVVAHLNWKR